MRKISNHKVGKGVLAGLLTVSMATMMTPASAFAANPWDTYVEAGEGQIVDETVDPISTDVNGGMSYAYDGGEATLSVDGDVSADGEGVWSYATGEDSFAGVYVDGGVESGKDSVTVTAYEGGYAEAETGDVVSEGLYGAYVESEGVFSYASVETGSILSQLGFQVTAESNGDATLDAKNVTATGASGEITVPNEVNAKGGNASVYADDIRSATSGINVDVSDGGTAYAQVKQIYSGGVGVDISNGVGMDGGLAMVEADGIEAGSIGILSMSWSGAMLSGVQVNGDIVSGKDAPEDKTSPGAVFINQDGTGLLSVTGDVTSLNGDGLVVSNYRNGSFIGVVDGTISGTENGVSVSGTGLENMNLAVWKIEAGDDGEIIAGDDEGVVASNVRYIVKVIQPDAGATIKATKSDGSDLEFYTPFAEPDEEDPEGFEVAYEGDQVLLKVDLEEGYSLAGAYNGEGQEQPLLIDDDGNYYIIVERGGGIYLSVRTMKDVETYTVTFVNDDGTELQSESLEAGATPAYKGEQPTKAEDAQYYYVFTGWTPEIDIVTGDITYKATYSVINREYNVTFVNYDGTELQADTATYGTTPEYKGETPVKASDDEYDYEFVGWTPEIDKVTGDVVYKATFKAVEHETDVVPATEDDTTPKAETKTEAAPAKKADTANNAKVTPKLADESIMFMDFVIAGLIAAGAVVVLASRKREEQ